MVSAPPVVVHMKPYMPLTEKPEILVAGDEGEAMLVVAGLDDSALHVPGPAAAVVTVVLAQIVWLGPAV